MKRRRGEGGERTWREVTRERKMGGKSGVVERERRCGEGSKVKGNGVKKIETSWEACLPEDRRSHWIYFLWARRRNPLQIVFSSRISKFLFVGWLIGWLVWGTL